ncbi:MAG: hypothetical protein LBK53_00110 [Heliobacteriaceae bacterium]|jgi:uncharacterized protein (UPF0332 family)|nr:hypothetical protein [Heliobacteriaceae bacterium]
MQPPHKDILIKRWMEKSDEAVETAVLSIENNFLSAALNRIYYAIYKDTFMYRQDSDYDVLYTPGIETVNKLLARAKEFVEEVSKIITA